MKIDVTQECIDEAETLRHYRTPASCCPIALAIKKAFPGTDVQVDGDSVSIYNPVTDDCLSDDLWGVAIDFIDTFDNGGTVHPFSFEMDVP